MRTKVTLILLFLNVALFFFIFKFERGWRTEEASMEARSRVLGAETADIRSLRISGFGFTTVNLDRQKDEKWALTEPIEWPANPHAVNRIINELQFLKHETSFSVADLQKNDQSLADYGLDNPRLTVSFTSSSTPEDGDNDAAISLFIGDETKVGNRLYVLSSDRSRVHVVNLSLAHSLTIPVEDLRADTVFSVPVFEARSLNLQNAANLRVRVRRDGNQWAFEAPIIARASKPNVELSINALNALRVRNFASIDTTEHNPRNNTTLRITLEGNNRRETLILGEAIGATAITEAATETNNNNPRTAPDIEYYAMLEGKTTLFTLSLPAVLIDSLLNAQVALRETHILDFSPDAVTQLTLNAPNQPVLTLQRLEANAQPDALNPSLWQIVRREGNQGPQTQSADDQNVRRVIEKLSLLSAQKFASDAPSDADLEAWGFNRPEREINITIDSGNSAKTLSLQIGVGVQPDNYAYVRVGNARYIYLIDSEILHETPASPLNYRQRLLRELPEAAKIEQLTIIDLEDNRIVFETTVSENIDENIKALVAQLRSLRAKRFVSSSFTDKVEVTGELQPWRYRLDTTISLPSSTSEQTEISSLYLSPRLGGATQLAGSAEFDTVFEVMQPLLDSLWTLIYAETDPGPPPAKETAPATETDPQP